MSVGFKFILYYRLLPHPEQASKSGLYLHTINLIGLVLDLFHIDLSYHFIH